MRGAPTAHAPGPIDSQGSGRPAVGRFGEIRRPLPNTSQNRQRPSRHSDVRKGNSASYSSLALPGSRRRGPASWTWPDHAARAGAAARVRPRLRYSTSSLAGFRAAVVRSNEFLGDLVCLTSKRVQVCGQRAGHTTTFWSARMRFSVTSLRYWKSEYGSLDRCEDSFAYDVSTGLFAVADGASQTSFSGIWSSLLVKQFVSEPLIENDEFEVDRWVRRAQRKYERAAPAESELPPLVRAKARKGSAATFLGIQLVPASESDPSEEAVAQCRVIAIGDCCLLHFRPSALSVSSLFIQTADDFDAMPMCFLSKDFDPAGCPLRVDHIYARQGDILVLATDAVAKWLLPCLDELRVERLSVLLSQTVESWPWHVECLRRAGHIVDDDSTALVIRLDETSGDLPGVPDLQQRLKKQRVKEWNTALQDRDEVELTLAYGSGSFFNSDARKKVAGEVRRCQAVTRALREMVHALRAKGSPEGGPREAILNAWRRNKDLLGDAICARDLIATLTDMGIRGAEEATTTANRLPTEEAGSSIIEAIDSIESSASEVIKSEPQIGQEATVPPPSDSPPPIPKEGATVSEGLSAGVVTAEPPNDATGEATVGDGSGNAPMASLRATGTGADGEG